MSANRSILVLMAAGLLAGAAARAEDARFTAADQACAACHAETIGAATYTSSVHASNGCASCHSDVDVAQHPGNVGALKPSERPAVAATRACASCHTDLVAQHDKWLPNATTHLTVVECAACHAPNAGRRVELRLLDASKQELALKPGELPAVKKLDAASLRGMVQRTRIGTGTAIVVGRIDVADPVDTHRLARKASAVKECATCHRKGSETFSRVALSLLGVDGQRSSYEVDASVLNDPESIDALRGFYALGGTRIGALDILLGLAVLGGITAPLGHALARRISRKDKPQ